MARDPMKLHAIIHAELKPFRWTDRRMVSGAIQKALLLVAWEYEGEVASIAAYAARASTSDGSAQRGLGALVRRGILKVLVDHCRYHARVYQIQMGPLLNCQSRVAPSSISKLRRKVPA